VYKSSAKSEKQLINSVLKSEI